VNPRWAPDGNGVYFDAQDRGSQNVYFASVSGGGAPKAVTTGTHVLTLDSASNDLIAAGTQTDPDHPQDVVKYSLKTPGAVTKLTNVNDGLLAGKQLAHTEEIWYTSSNNTKVQGWIV
jgi:dipeptidyl aminopeptidase/acylaminoacyl peptidase